MSDKSIPQRESARWRDYAIAVIFASVPLAYLLKGGTTATSFLDLSLMTVVVSAIVALVSLIQRRKFRVLKTYDFITYLLLIWLLCGALYSSNQTEGLDKFARFLVFGVAQIYIGRVLLASQRLISLTVEVFIWISTLIGVVNLVPLVGLHSPSLVQRLTYSHVSAIPLSGAMSMGLYATLVRFVSPTRRIGYRFVNVALGLVFLLNLLFIGSRGPLIGLLLLIGILPFILPADFRRRRGLALAILAPIAIAGLMSTHVRLPLVARWYRLGLMDASVSDRVLLLKSAFREFASSPIVGIGTAGYGPVCIASRRYTYPHNLFAEVTCENGVIGVILMLMWVLGGLHGYIKPPPDAITLTLWGWYLLSLFHLQVSMTYAMAKLLCFSAALLGSQRIASLSMAETKPWCRVPHGAALYNNKADSDRVR